MLQTFDDMLQAEPSKFGRLRIWARTLVDLPVSATKEHITNGRNIAMSRNTKIVVTAIFAVLLLANGASWWFGNLHARVTEGVEKVSAAKLADAMQNDSFYSSYGDAAVLFDAKVAKLTKVTGTTLVTFDTHTTYSLQCQFTNAVHVSVGQEMSVAAPAGRAERLPRGVLLHDCLQD